MIVLLLLVLALAVGLGLGWLLPPNGRRSRDAAPRARRILLPITGEALSTRALEAAFRLARAEQATLMPVYLATVPRRLALDAPLPRTADHLLPLVEAIEQRAARQGIAVDPRVSRGRTPRHALERLLGEEPVDRIVIAARRDDDPGFAADEVAWMLSHAGPEVVVLRPGPEDHRAVTGRQVRGHF